ncbi:MAG: M15 family metallopeptidase [Ruminococcus sp.]|nr:M15 family metallopeptidase [Ruminococcus sp.]
MILLINKNNLFNKEMLDTIEMIEYKNYQGEKVLIERETFKHFEVLRDYLRINGIVIDIEDCYRSLEAQNRLFSEFEKRYGIDYASTIVAIPGTSEHHTGQAVDIVIKKDNKWITENADLLNETEIFKRIHESLKYFGFILRYPKGKEDITGYPYEPWHFRYIGKEDAMLIGDQTLEEYLIDQKSLNSAETRK